MLRISWKYGLWVLVSALVLFSGASVLLRHGAAQAQSTAMARGLPDFTELVEQTSPSVVNIRTLERVRADAPSLGGMDEEMQEFFRRFFGQPFPGQPRQPQRPNRPPAEEERPRGVGSGFILSSDGYIMTNAHVVDGADEVLVTLADKREFKAKIVGADKRTDVAVVKIDAMGLPAVRIGDVSRLKVGEWVLAIGSPFGLENSVTAGIVSAKQRETGEYLPFIQTDVAINPGNSGGPLINMRGEVVGINSQIYSRSGGYMGISFAIPIDEASRVADQLRASGRVTRGMLGVRIDTMSKELAESLGLPKPQGAVVVQVESGSAAEKAGLEPGDIVLRFDGRPIEKATDLSRMVSNTKPGSKSTLTILRNKVTKDLAIVVGEVAPEKPTRTSARDDKTTPPATAQFLGLSVSDLSTAQKNELKLKSGVRVDAATEAAARAGLRPGDVILSLANTEVADVKAFNALVAKLDKTKPVNVLVRRGEWAQYVLIRPGR